MIGPVEDRLGREVQVGGGSPAVPPSSSSTPPEQEIRFNEDVLTSSLFQVLEESTALKELVARMIAGTEPYSRPLAYWESKKFNASSVNVVLLRAAGFRPKEIKGMIGYKTDATVSIILKHPYGRQLMAALLPYTAVQALNMKTKIQGYAAQLVDRLYEVGMDSEDEQVVARIGFGMMDRAGFSAPREAKISHTHSMAAPAASINRLSQALEESMQVSQIPVEADYEIIESPSQPESNNDEERVA